MNGESTVRFAIEKGFFTCMNDVFKLDLSTIEKLTYIALTRYADTSNKAWPKYETLARDVSCSRKRVIQAVSRLVECRLVVKHERKNRTNIYLVYPPEYFCKPLETDQNSTKEGEESTPQIMPGVTVEHPGSEPAAPQGCNVVTSGVSPEHPISTSTITSDNNSSTTEPEAEGKEIPEPTEQDIASVVRVFKSKGVQVQNSVIRDMLAKYSVREIKGAVHCTDFNASRNPLAVINKLLLTGNYVMPAEREKPEPPQIQNQELGDEEAIRQMIKSAKEGLQKKFAATAPA